jgi:exopolyphosphatase/guanosine-5'-triphosphate,3'-diphosphate pyrophosphatase
MELPIRRAVIDVGTNSTKLLVGDVAAGQVAPVLETSIQTRLGEGFYEAHQLQSEPMARTAAAISELAAKARQLEAESIRVFATSAAREANNPQGLVKAVLDATGLKLEIISGAQEADWAFRGVTGDPELAARPVLILDLGGGSAEFILGAGSIQHFRHSFPLGTVRLLQKIPHGDPPQPSELEACRDWVRSFLLAEVAPRVQQSIQWEKHLSGDGPLILVGTGGTATILARMELELDSYDREKLEAANLTLPIAVAHGPALEPAPRRATTNQGASAESRRRHPGRSCHL